MKNSLFIALGLLVVSSVAFAEPPQTGKERDGQESSRREQMRKRWQQGGAGENAARPGMRGFQGDPAQMVSMMIERFDEDGDKKLDAQELTNLLTKMRGMMGRRPGPGGPGAPGAQVRGKGIGEEGQAGGQRPKRPARPAKSDQSNKE